MPVFPYRCVNGHDVEQSYDFGEKKANTIQCFCGRRATRQITFPAIQFKGEGFSRAAPISQTEKLSGNIPPKGLSVSVSDDPAASYESVRTKSRFHENDQDNWKNRL